MILSWTADEARNASENWSKKLQYAIASKQLFRNFVKMPPGLTVNNAGDTHTMTFVRLDESDPGTIAENQPTPDWAIDYFQVDYSTEEYGGKITITEKNRQLTAIDVEEIVKKTFATRMASGLEHAVARQFRATGALIAAEDATAATVRFRYDGVMATGWTVAAGAAADCDNQLVAEHLVPIYRHLIQNGLEPDGEYINCILSDQAYDSLWVDTDFIGRLDAAYTSAKERHPFIRPGVFKGTSIYFGFRFYVTPMPTLLGTYLVGAVNVGGALFFGKSPIIEHPNVAPQVVVIKSPTEPLRRVDIFTAAMIGHRIDQPLPTEPAILPSNTQALMKGLGQVWLFGGGTAA